MLSRSFYSFFLIFLIGSSFCYGQSIYGKVVSITDGDTFKLLTQDSIVHRIRIASIDCPEKKQPFSKLAKQFTSDAIVGKNICLDIISKDRYGRSIAIVYYDDFLTLNEALVKNGFAWHFLKYSKDPSLDQLEEYARKNKLGLWIDKNPIPPWEWRKK
ncbi:thermonuclease family protein [Jejudonia soesokkakensis]|uniref:Thermonuclease family protein n=1 Tax=Jejudonia soesokkakensis TaxID=1323432 RepID=A0ABW2MS52_9FLAO